MLKEPVSRAVDTEPGYCHALWLLKSRPVILHATANVIVHNVWSFVPTDPYLQEPMPLYIKSSPAKLYKVKYSMLPDFLLSLFSGRREE